MDALGQRLKAGSFHRGQPVAQHGGEDLDHLTVAVVGTGQLRRTRSSAVGNTQSLNGAPLRRARGLRVRIGT